MFDVIVIGGGHAGCEAAAAAARRGAHVALVTMSAKTIGAMSCNPSIGGIGKGHIVREVDALDGLMGRAADRAAIHYRLLNRSKGRAVQGPRIQADRVHYARAVRAILDQQRYLTVVEGSVDALALSGRKVTGIILNDGKELQSRAVVLATGTFLGGKLYRGGERGEGGRVFERAATRLARQLRDLELPVRRLKTGTPPRLDGRTIDWSRLDQQPSDADDWTMSPLEQRVLPQLHCAITRTTAATHDLIRHGLATSPLFTGAIEADGPRYCPSIEDKVVRFGDRDGHQVFLEPEGVATNLVYPNGISTSLSTEVQTALVRSIPGLERADIVEPGYAVEYDYLDPRHLTHELETREIGGLFCAGQINGTTGYEEAAGQGLVAGANAAGKALELSPLRLERDESYIGVMIDDLVLAGVSEPYRMLTARAEYRLQLRADNATTRLSAKGEALGLLGAERSRFASEYFAEVDRARAGASDVSMAALQELEDDKLYAPYIERQRQETRKRALFGGRSVPSDLDYSSIPGLSNEMRERLSSVRPATIGEAGRIPGVTPAALTALLAAVQKLAA